jgi:hypothetical protein
MDGFAVFPRIRIGITNFFNFDWINLIFWEPYQDNIKNTPKDLFKKNKECVYKGLTAIIES